MMWRACEPDMDVSYRSSYDAPRDDLKLAGISSPLGSVTFALRAPSGRAAWFPKWSMPCARARTQRKAYPCLPPSGFPRTAFSTATAIATLADSLFPAPGDGQCRRNKESFPEFPEAVYWVRQIIALVCGVAWGILPLRGMMGIVLFVSVSGNHGHRSSW